MSKLLTTGTLKREAKMEILKILIVILMKVKIISIRLIYGITYVAVSILGLKASTLIFK